MLCRSISSKTGTPRKRFWNGYLHRESSNIVKNDQDKKFDDEDITNLDSITLNRNPTIYEEVSKKSC